MLTDIARQLPWHGVKAESRGLEANFHGRTQARTSDGPQHQTGRVLSIGRSSSDLSKSEMSNLMSLIEAFAAQHGVTLHDEEEAA